NVLSVRLQTLDLRRERLSLDLQAGKERLYLGEPLLSRTLARGLADECGRCFPGRAAKRANAKTSVGRDPAVSLRLRGIGIQEADCRKNSLYRLARDTAGLGRRKDVGQRTTGHWCRDQDRVACLRIE